LAREGITKVFVGSLSRFDTGWGRIPPWIAKSPAAKTP
jgi:hypothetical protein